MEADLNTVRHRNRRLIGWIAVASIVAIGILGSTGAGVAAAPGTTWLHQTPPIASTAPGYGDECDGVNLAPGQVLWHFVLVQTTSSSATLTATFANAGTIIKASDKYTGMTLHFTIITGADTLLGASVDAAGRWLNLSHICVGPVITTTTTSTSTTTTSSSTSTSSSASN